MSSHLKTNCRKQKRNCKKQKGISGIGTLIIFIALILVAAVAAIVLLQTSESLQSRAVATGKESEQQVSTKLQVDRVTGHITSDNNEIDHILIQGRLAPGSANVDLSETIFTYSTPSEFSPGLTYSATSDGNNTRAAALEVSRDSNGLKYSVHWLGKGANWDQAQKVAIIPGQEFELIYYVGNLGRNIRVELSLLPSIGAQTYVRFRTPVALDGNYITMFP